jgi:hypothetical protein
MDSRSRQNHRSKKSWVPNVEINPLGQCNQHYFSNQFSILRFADTVMQDLNRAIKHRSGLKAARL